MVKRALTRRESVAPQTVTNDSDDIVPFSARLTELANRLAGARQSSRQPRRETDATGRVWPQLAMPPATQDKAPDAKPATQPDQVAERDLVIADLTGQQLAQAEELRNACAQIDHLIEMINALRHEGDSRDLDLATSAQRLIEAENDNADLQATLNAERQKSAALEQRLLEIESEFNDHQVGFTANRETADQLAREMAEMRVEVPKALAAAEVRAHRLFAEQLERLSERHEQQIDQLQTELAERERQTAHLEKTHAELAALFAALSGKIAGLEADKEQAAETIRRQAGQIEFLETTIKVERENADATIKELIAEFGRERERLLARDQDAAEIRKNIVQLLPQLMARHEAADTAQVTARVA